MKKLKWIALGLVLLLLGVIVFRNLEETNVELVFVTVRLPLAALLIATLATGFGLGFFASAAWRVHSWRAKSKSKKGHDEADSAGSSTTQTKI